MDSNNDKSRKPLSDGQPPLPPELDWERMEAGILQKMEKLEPGKAPRRSNTFLKIAASVVLLAILILLLKHCSQTSRKVVLENAVASQKQPVEAPTAPEVQFPSSVAELAPPSTSREPSPTTTGYIGRRKGEKGLSSLSPSPKMAGKTMQTANSENDSTSPTRRSAASSVPFGQVANGAENFVPERTDLAAEEALLNAATPGATTSDAPFEGQSPIITEVLLSKTFFVEGEKAQPKLPEFTTAKPGESPSFKDKDRVFLLAGATAWGIGYGSKKPERHDFENATVSFNAGLSYVHTLRNNFTLTIGMQLQQLESRFEWSQDLTYRTTLMDTILTVQVNALTGGRQEVRGDVEIDVPAKRMVQHHNTIRLYQIPFAIGRTWSSEKWQADVLLGGALTVFSKNNGRTLYQGEVLDYEGSSTSLVSTQGKLQALLASRLTYQLTKKTGLTTGIQFQKSLSNWSREQNIQIRPNILNLELGLKYSL